MTSRRNVAVFKVSPPRLASLQFNPLSGVRSPFFTPQPSRSPAFTSRCVTKLQHSVFSSEKFLGSIIGKYVVQTQRMFEFMRLSKNGGNESRFVQLTTKHVQPILSAVIIGAHTVSRHILTCTENPDNSL